MSKPQLVSGPHTPSLKLRVQLSTSSYVQAPAVGPRVQLPGWLPLSQCRIPPAAHLLQPWVRRARSMLLCLNLVTASLTLQLAGHMDTSVALQGLCHAAPTHSQRTCSVAHYAAGRQDTSSHGCWGSRPEVARGAGSPQWSPATPPNALTERVPDSWGLGCAWQPLGASRLLCGE